MKNWKIWAMMLMAGVAFTACDDDEEITAPGGTIRITNESSGVLILNNGNQGRQIDGDFSVIDYADGTIVNNIFSTTNGRSLGVTPNRSLIYGDKVYATVTESNTVEVAKRSNLSSLKQIRFANDETAGQPRALVGYGPYVYVSMFSGHVARIDTSTLTVDQYVAVGSYPEEMAVLNGKLYVPNSGYGSGTTATEVDLASFTKVRDIEVPVNPVEMLTDAQGNLYVRSSGWYDQADGWKQKDAAVFRLSLDGGEPVKVADATLACIPEGSNVLYTVNYPYGATETTYSKINLNVPDDNYTGIALTIQADAPAAIGVDPVNGNIVLTSYSLVDGYPSYTTPGYANVYNSDGQLLNRYETGVGPCGISFFTAKHIVIE